MAKKRKMYNDYRRPRTKRRSLLLKIIVVILLLVLAAFLVFSKVLGGSVKIVDGKLDFILPGSQEEPPPSDPEVTETPPLVIIEPSEEPTDQPEPETDPVPPIISAIEVPIERLLDGSAVQGAADAGANAIVVTMKPTSGELAWSSEDTAVPDAVRALAQESELHLVARVACFRDQALVKAGTGGPLTTPSGRGWYDYYGMRWVSPVSDEVRTYLIRLCIELCDMGFDEILLEFAGYPYFGETHVLGTNELRPEDLTAPVEQFWQEMSMALSETDVLLSALVADEMVAGTDEYSGIGPELLTLYADRVWVKSGETDCVTPLEQAGMEQAAQRIVYIGGTEEDVSRAEMKNVIG